MDLRFVDNFDIAELARDLFRFIEGRRDFTRRRGDIELLQQLLGLIFVNVHSRSGVPQHRRYRFQRKWNSLQNADQQRFFFCELACHFENAPTTVAGVRKSMKFPLWFARCWEQSPCQLQPARPNKRRRLPTNTKKHSKGRTRRRLNHSSIRRAPILRSSVVRQLHPQGLIAPRPLISSTPVSESPAWLRRLHVLLAPCARGAFQSAKNHRAQDRQCGSNVRNGRKIYWVSLLKR